MIWMTNPNPHRYALGRGDQLFMGPLGSQSIEFGTWGCNRNRWVPSWGSQSLKPPVFATEVSGKIIPQIFYSIKNGVSAIR